MWITRPPAASIRAAAAITSMTMNGGTLLRVDGVIRRLAASSIVEASRWPYPRIPAPLLPHSAASVPRRAGNRGAPRAGINLPGAMQWGEAGKVRAAPGRGIDGRPARPDSGWIETAV